MTSVLSEGPLSERRSLLETFDYFYAGIFRQYTNLLTFLHSLRSTPLFYQNKCVVLTVN